MTDREKLIELLTNSFDTQYNRRQLITPVHTADHLLANGVTFANVTSDLSNWISVEERLPAPMVSVITSRKFLDCEIRESIVDYQFIDIGGGSMWHKDLLSWKSVVTHWMPLPEPPKED